MTKSKPSKPKSKTPASSACHRGPFRVAACWPHQDAPLIMAMLGDGKFVVATSFTPVNFDTLLDLRVCDLNDKTCDPSMACDLPRWIFGIPYESFATNERTPPTERPVAWSIKAALIWYEGKNEPHYVARPDASSARFHLDPSRELKNLLADAQKWNPPEIAEIALLPVKSDESYLENVHSIISSIRDGEFYQVNLLRFFQAAKAGGWENLCMRLECFSGPYGCIFTQGSRVVASFSPERFIEISNSGGKTKIDSWPMKGTSSRVTNDPVSDQKSGQALLESEKDQAELRMIIDLIRNDLTKICETGSIDVVSAGSLRMFPKVWHLEGHVMGMLRPDIKLQELLQALCPGGSITGAPKIASMQRIRADEGQPRGFFMGNLFTIMHDGTVKSNILIRTLISDNWMRSARYAAGSGLVIKSTPEMELNEIRSKCAVITSANT